MGQLAAKLPGARQNARKWPRSNVPGGRVEGELPEINLSGSTASSLPLLMPTSPERPENAGQEPKRREEIGFSRGGLPTGRKRSGKARTVPREGTLRESERGDFLLLFGRAAA